MTLFRISSNIEATRLLLPEERIYRTVPFQMTTDPSPSFELGDFVRRNHAVWIYDGRDEYGRGRGIGIVEPSKDILKDGEYRIRWPAGWSVELGDHLLSTKMGTLMHVDSIAPIQEWSRERGFPLLDMPTNARRINLLALDGVELVGEIVIVEVNQEPSKFLVTSCSINVPSADNRTVG